ncbi:Uma2 family endonuclease [cf. Phormidesmis sp. LEGE 11477]|uniref:Uma2 family endonuclease n=1 Tax=cf. Phormidesmis sp. LEGE 11477 TaxID=1828680 RepID=UPI001882BF1A|nr:Uma2 family endonuclease [cf. Phormidesmis sp. LEGE 11477]MBE9064018.1 Uma2 family endonuclease [cf. Phormidesmis sp. LEGE 11477]
MVSQPLSRLPSTTELPCSDDIPVGLSFGSLSRSEEQNLLPNLLLLALASLWAERMDWFFGVDMAVYHTTGVSTKVPVVPDAFLSIGVERQKANQPRGRLSYAMWEEGETAPILAIELVSQTPGKEYGEKLEIYHRLGVLYYVVYNPLHWKRDQHQPFEVYKLEAGEYQLQLGEPFWMPEVGLGIGRARQLVGGLEREVLLWHNEQGQAYPVPEAEMKALRSQLRKSDQRAQAAEQRAEAERQRAEAAERQIEVERQRAAKLIEQLRSLGIDPDKD